jgi:hypothetical protein
VAYRLKLPNHCTIHPVFHVSQLKKCVSNSVQISSTLPDPGVAVYQVPEKILDTRRIKKGETDINQVVVQWSKLSHELATWEDKEALQQQFTGAPAWGQPGLQAPGSVSSADRGSRTGGAKRARRASTKVIGPEWIN